MPDLTARERAASTVTTWRDLLGTGDFFHLEGMIAADIESAEARGRAAGLAWINPTWRSLPSDSDGCWPWCGDQFLAAVPCVNNVTGKGYWEFHVLSWDESGLLDADGESWSAWSESDIEWIARIPTPPETQS